MRQTFTSLFLCFFYLNVQAIDSLFTQITITNKGTNQIVKIEREENPTIVFEGFKATEGEVEIKADLPLRLVCHKRKNDREYLYTTLIIKPGEHIFIDNLEDSLYIYVAKGNPIRNNELAFFSAMERKLGGFEGLLTYIPHKRNKPEIFRKTLADLTEERRSFLNDYKRLHPISSWFDSLLNSAFRYKEYYDFYTYSKREGTTLAELRSSSGYASFEQEIVYSKESDDLIYFQEAFLSKLLSEYPVSTEKPEQYNVWSSLCEGKTREFVLFNFLKHSTKSKYISKSLSTFRNDYSNSLLGIHSLKKFEEYTINEPTDNKFLDEEMSCYDCLLSMGSKKAITWDSLINEIGVVKYIDFWASWCGGCRASFDDVRKLQDEYKSQDLKVIFVSIDTLPVAWTKASEKEKLSDKENFLFLNFDESSVKEKYSIPPIARYMLVDKNGRVISAEAPKPSSFDLRATINRLLSEK